MGEGRRRSGTTLLLLNGLPGVGKSTVAAALAALRAGTLVLDVDVVRALISGDPADTAEPARRLALDMARSHLRSGADVVVPQLVARPDQVVRFERSAAGAGARFAHVLLVATPETRARRVAHDVATHRQGLDPAVLDAYDEGLRRVADLPGVVRVDADAEPGGVAHQVEPLLDG
ncbi:ATP-binding protein [Isoptericola sp. 4D.3]|uniref:ATP-binding protein n=1 Tax=Isoptericola peretonis TaxID=2918523 RepID=A0ABT0J835_9MICO|nr:ATP-binding protein [Isoptericola sp. 4D.3]